MLDCYETITKFWIEGLLSSSLIQTWACEFFLCIVIVRYWDVRPDFISVYLRWESKVSQQRVRIMSFVECGIFNPWKKSTHFIEMWWTNYQRIKDQNGHITGSVQCAHYKNLLIYKAISNRTDVDWYKVKNTNYWRYNSDYIVDESCLCYVTISHMFEHCCFD
jgi:hypothetical protein